MASAKRATAVKKNKPPDVEVEGKRMASLESEDHC